MNPLQAILLGIVEGITEFLPVSSTGHLILTTHLLAIPQTEFLKTFEICIQVGAILSVLFVYFRSFYQKQYLLKNVFIAFIPAAIAGLVLYKIIKSLLLENVSITVYTLIIGGIFLLVFEKYFYNKKSSITLKNLTIKQALIIGIFQSIALIPGVSRSAATIVAGMVIGLEREEAVEFSFLLAVPTILAATLFDLFQSSYVLSSENIILMFLGGCAAFISAFFTIHLLLKFVRSHTFIPFGIYRIIVGIIFLFFILR